MIHPFFFFLWHFSALLLQHCFLLCKECVQIGCMSEWKCLVLGGWSTLTSSCWGSLINHSVCSPRVKRRRVPMTTMNKRKSPYKMSSSIGRRHFHTLIRCSWKYCYKEKKKTRCRDKREKCHGKKNDRQVNVLIRHIFLWKWLEMY